MTVFAFGHGLFFQVLQKFCMCDKRTVTQAKLEIVSSCWCEGARWTGRSFAGGAVGCVSPMLGNRMCSREVMDHPGGERGL